jgi:hypothetical protein
LARSRPFGQRPGSLEIARLDAQRKRRVEDLLHVAEQPGLEFITLELATQRVSMPHRLEIGGERLNPLPLGQQNPPHAFGRPQLLVRRVGSRAGGGDLAEQRQRGIVFTDAKKCIGPAAQMECAQLGGLTRGQAV